MPQRTPARRLASTAQPSSTKRSCDSPTHDRSTGRTGRIFSRSPPARCAVCWSTWRAHPAPRSAALEPRICPWNPIVAGTAPDPIDLIAVDEALDTLAKLDARKVRVIELRFFAGLTVEETASVLDVSPDTVARDWRMARSWLLRELARLHRLPSTPNLRTCSGHPECSQSGTRLCLL